MIRLLGLKGLILITFLTLGIALVAGYTLLSARSYVSGMDSIIAGQLGRAAMQGVAYELGVPGPREEFVVTRTWAQQPQPIRDAFEEPPEQPGTLYKAHVGGEAPFARLYLATRHMTPAGERFVTQQLAAMPPMPGRFISPTQSRLLNLTLIGVGSALLVGLVVVLLLNRVSRPIAALGSWAATRNEHNLNEPVPDFVFPELNRFAELMRASLSTAQQGLEREQLFLRHTSHELRTPISVVRNNLELLRKIQTSTPEQPDPRQTEIVSRIERASLTMKDVTETLLWLGRDDASSHPCTHLRVDLLIAELVEGLRYLLQGKQVELSVQVEPAELYLPDTPTRIVLGNLIRNAFQHTHSGAVAIRQQGDCVRIVNTQRDQDDGPSDTGFGLGLKLTERFTERLGWQYRNQTLEASRSVEIRLTASETEA